MAPFDAKRTLGEIGAWVDGKVVGDPGLTIARPVPAGVPDPEGITFAGAQEYVDRACSGPIGAIIVTSGLSVGETPHIIVENARLAFAQVLQAFHRPPALDPGISPMAHVHPTARIAESARIGPFVSVGPDASIGEHAKVHAHCHVGDRCHIGAESVLHPRAVLVQDVKLGDRCLIHSGAVIGADGFGFEWGGDSHKKLAQIGGVRIGNDVEIGANTCIDRGAMDDTVIGDGVKIDNLCQVAHNVQIGAHSLLTGMVGIGGSTVLGKRFVAGAGAGISDHVNIVDDVRVGGRSGVASNVDEPGDYAGFPLQRMPEALRTLSIIGKLPELWRRVRALESRNDRREDE